MFANLQMTELTVADSWDLYYLRYLPPLPSIRSIHPIKLDTDYASLKVALSRSFPGLTSLDLSFWYIHAELKNEANGKPLPSCLPKLKHLRTLSLRISWHELTDDDFAIIATYKELEVLRLTHDDVEFDGQQDDELITMGNVLRALGAALACTPVRALFLLRWSVLEIDYYATAHPPLGVRYLRALLKPFAMRSPELGGGRLQLLFGDFICPREWHEDVWRSRDNSHRDPEVDQRVRHS